MLKKGMGATKKGRLYFKIIKYWVPGIINAYRRFTNL